MLVSDWMTRDPLTVTPDTPVMDALKMIKERRVRRLPVMQGSKMVGITTRKDLKDAMPSKATTLSVWELNYLLSKLTVEEIMARPVITATEGEHMEDAALRMQEHKIGGLPVVGERGELAGIITTSDVIRAFTDIMGLNEGGQRLTLDMPDVPGSLQKAVSAVQPSNIVSVATYDIDGPGGNRRFVLRVNGQDTDGVRDRVRAAGISVLE
ncbi:acetoin utilization protein AcuB [Deinococcus reticulitermitis]|uniref:Acetoin utilization protein AcuB n=1 Tax=Deinococcus reticulitermitis TaxID=856736 RepID=A0A1H6S5R7_9DEIO|nr:CBS domain-containing protein [Deinococcus reticulitermitis]SEI59360.1 acetoin utilization protein AcuB [Deinococcus reticulitermitis]